MTNPADAFARAFSRGPLSRQFQCFAQVLEPAGRSAGRPKVGHFRWMFTAPGALRWRDVEASEKGEQITSMAGTGVATLFTPYDGPLPVLLHSDKDGWLFVANGLERDGLGAGLRLAVQRWSGDLPVIDGGLP